MKEQIAGLDIGIDYAAAAQIAVDENGAIDVQHHGYTSLDVDWPKERKAAVIKELWKKSNIQTSTVCSCYHSSALLLKSFRYSNVQEEELESTLYLDAEEALQAPPDQICLDWFKFDPGKGATYSDRNSMNGIMVAAAKDRVERYLSLLRKADLFPVELDVRCLASTRLFCELEKQSIIGRHVHFCFIAGRLADMAIISPDCHVFPRSVNSRGEPWLRTSGYLAEQIDEQLKYHEYKMQKKPVEEIYVCGEAAASEQLRDAIHQKTGVPVTLWNPFGSLMERDMPQDCLPGTYGLRLIAAIGLAWREQQDA